LSSDQSIEPVIFSPGVPCSNVRMRLRANSVGAGLRLTAVDVGTLVMST